VADDGSAQGTPGLPGASRFGDIRLGGYAKGSASSDRLEPWLDDDQR
jgi:hypothetical protein